MRISSAVIAAAWLMSSAADLRADLQCVTGPENDRRLAALHARPRDREQARVAANAAAAPALINGAIYLPANEEVAPGYRPFDLEGQSLTFRPGTAGGYAVSRESLQYVEPAAAGQLVGSFIPADLGFTFSAFGRSVQRVYVSAYMGITFDEPKADAGVGFGELETLLRPQPLIAPLMQTTRSLRPLPVVHVDRTPSSLIVTWRGAAHQWFGYDVQAALHQDGSIVFSYKSFRNMRWGTPVVAAGTGAGDLPRRVLFSQAIAPGITAAPTEPPLRDMLDLTHVEVSRIAESEIFSIRMTLAAAIDRSKLQGNQSLKYHFILGNEFATITVNRTETLVTAFNTFQAAPDGVTGRVEGNTVEIFGLQSAPRTTRTERLNVVTFLGTASRATDVGTHTVTLEPAPRGRFEVDLSAVSDGSERPLPIFEPFVLPNLDPYALWDQLKAAYNLTDDGIDGVAIYQTFFTDLVLYATAYATMGNAQIDGIHPPDPERGSTMPRMPNLMHMNQLDFDENADDRMASVLMLHEFGHRWLYTLQFAEGATKSNALSPASYHPAAYVDTRSAFALYGPRESSVMGGGYFTSLGGNRYRASSRQYGYSWTDLYLMGLAGPEEVPSWFYLAGTDPELPDAYFPTDGIEVTGTKRDVELSQVVAVQGPRNPPQATSQRAFRVLFVLVTDPGSEPTAAEIAKIEWLREKMERDFSLATGGRGRLTTDRAGVKKRRSVR
ncbi:MAG TPA: hypothetical protein VGF28_10520 [Thermoanaerobaculia bacterium]|jgi:hypothetical protein